MAPVSDVFIKAIKQGDLAALKACLASRPQDLQEAFIWDGGSGFALNCAAAFNQSRIIEYLVREQHQDVNRQDGVSSSWTPLHHAESGSAYSAAATLLQLGANPRLKNSSGATTEGFCKSEFVETLEPGYQERLKLREQKDREQKAAGTWTRSGQREVVHSYEPEGSGCRLIDIFNFETRCWRAISKDLNGSGMGQSVMLFDGMDDNTILLQALAKLKELGGTAKDDEIDRDVSLKKTPLLRPSSQ